MNTQERNRKLEIFDKHKEYAMFDEILSINDRIRDIKETLSNIDVKEVKTYEEELGLLQESLKDLTNVLNGKDMVVNIPLDNLANQLVRVEQAIKNIKEVKIPDYPEFPELPEFPDTITLSDTQINELLLAINSIPQFPITELENAINNLREEFDYGFLDEKFNKLIKAIKGISISVTSGGGGFPGDLVNVNSHTKSKEVRVYQENHICQENTTSTPLAANATFTGAWQDCLNYQEVNISVATDQNSATS